MTTLDLAFPATSIQGACPRDRAITNNLSGAPCVGGCVLCKTHKSTVLYTCISSNTSFGREPLTIVSSRSLSKSVRFFHHLYRRCVTDGPPTTFILLHLHTISRAERIFAVTTLKRKHSRTLVLNPPSPKYINIHCYLTGGSIWGLTLALTLVQPQI